MQKKIDTTNSVTSVTNRKHDAPDVTNTSKYWGPFKLDADTYEFLEKNSPLFNRFIRRLMTSLENENSTVKLEHDNDSK